MINLINSNSIEQVVLAYGAESDRVLGIPREVCGFLDTFLWLIVDRF